MIERMRELQFSHRSEDCAGTTVPRSLFLTGNYELLVLPHCRDCGREFQVQIPLERLIVECPGTQPITRTPTITAGDLAFLQEMHIVPDLQ